MISVQTTDGNVFDAIVFGEREPKRWMAGSDVFRRTQSFGGEEEAEANSKPVHIAIVYNADGTITAYRNGQPYGKPYKSSGPVTFKADASQVIFGLRHGRGAATGRMLAGRIYRAQLYDRALSAEEIAASAGIESQYVSEEQLAARLSAELRQQRERLKRDQQRAQQELDALNRAAAEQSIYTVVPTNPAPTRLLYRGSVTDEGPVIDPGASDCIKGVPGDLELAPNASDADRRKALAAWITDRNNALFARVIVNRLWQHHFGTGIIETPSDFGYNGGRPSHPELLDYLGQELIRSGYRLKPVHRLIMMSSAYRQSSTQYPAPSTESAPDPRSIDANNRLLWRFSPQRLEGEVVRDAMLKVAGRLDERLGGAPFVDVKITRISNSNYYESFDKEDPAFNRRTLYRLSIRGGRSALLDTFDCPDPSATAPRRSVTTTPLQALSLLNNAFVLRMADHLAARVQKESGEDVSKQVDRTFALVIQREPDEVEREAGIVLVRKHGIATLARALFNSNEFVIAE